jgi:hypothetical protein
MDYLIAGTGGIGGLIALLLGALALALNVLLAIAVHRDAARLDREGRPTWFVDKSWWAVAVFLFSLPGAAIYWAMHHSSLRR